jgi:hypothetical protein
MCSPSFTAITSGRDSVQQARQLQCRLVALSGLGRLALSCGFSGAKQTCILLRTLVTATPNESAPLQILVT